MIKIDLHTHTNASDGSLSPTNLILEASKAGLTAIAVTDHDTVSGIDEALEAGNKLGIRVIPGVELSVDDDYGSFHMLILGVDHKNSVLNETLMSLSQARDLRNKKMVENLNRLGYPITFEQVAKVSGNGSASRGHIAQVLVQQQFIPSIEAAFSKLIGRGKPAYADRFRLSLLSAVELAHNAGGVTIWAHPGLHDQNQFSQMISQLSEWSAIGLDGIESDYSLHSRKFAQQLRNYALSNNMIYSGGSDFHGDLKPKIKLGNGPQGDMIDPAILSMLDERLKSLRTPLTLNYDTR